MPREGLAANKVEWIAGILNGTTNYILTEMKENNLAFDVALKQAQELGFAEADPTFDIEGVNKTFMDWEHDKHNDIMGYRNKSYKSLMTGTMAPVHHTDWLKELDDSYESYMKN
jgi:cation diffusion facilitator CzcD-associated flavoprotein CzcO